jgi:hypothetical protein
VFVFCLYIWIYLFLFFKNEYPNFGNSKGLHQSIEFTRSITKGMGVVLCKDFWRSDLWKLMCCIHVFSLVKWNNDVKEIWLYDLYKSKNFKPLYDEEGGFFANFLTKFRWPLVQVRGKFGKCICYLVYACFAFCLFVSLFFWDNSICHWSIIIIQNNKKFTNHL